MRSQKNSSVVRVNKQCMGRVLCMWRLSSLQGCTSKSSRIGVDLPAEKCTVCQRMGVKKRVCQKKCVFSRLFQRRVLMCDANKWDLPSNEQRIVGVFLCVISGSGRLHCAERAKEQRRAPDKRRHSVAACAPSPLTVDARPRRRRRSAPTCPLRLSGTRRPAARGAHCSRASGSS